jgi:hypothetical protein
MDLSFHGQNSSGIFDPVFLSIEIIIDTRHPVHVCGGIPDVFGGLAPDM